jgi:Secretion system C-terminal sorting domain
MQKTLLRFTAMLALVFSLISTIQGQQIVGQPIRIGAGITKTVDEIMAFGRNAEMTQGATLIPEMVEERHLPLELPNPGEENRQYRRWPLNNISSGNQDITGISTGTGISGVTQEIWSNFMATDFTTASGGWPPDNNGDVGTTQVFIAQNFRFKVYAKPSVTAPPVTTPNGTSTALLAGAVLDISQNNFFRTAFTGVNTTDPHIRFDRLTSRWFVVSQSTNESTNNYLLFAVSSGATITGMSSFTFFRVRMSDFPVGNPDIGKFLDYPTLGVDKNSLYVGANIFNSSAGGFSHASAYVINKTDMIAGVLTITPFSAVGSGSGAGNDIRTPQGVHNDDPAATDGYFIGASVFFSELVIRKVTYSGSTPSMSPEVKIPVLTNRSPVKQPAFGSSGNLDASNTRLFAAMLMKNKITGVTSLWTAHNIGVTSAGVSSTVTANNDRNASRWYEITNFGAATPTVSQTGTFFNNDALGSQRGFWFPSIAMTGQGHAALITSSSTPIDFIDIVVAGRYRTTPATDLEDSVFATATGSGYNPISGSFVDRWGDYSQVCVDPQDNMTMWAFHQYCNSTNSYGVRAIQIKAPPPPPATATAAGGNFCGTSVLVTINGINFNNAEFFDPGPDAGGPGFNRLTITSTGGVPVSNVTFVSPLQVTCRINTATRAAGTYTLIITNPDGQFTTANYTLAAVCNPVPVTLLSFTGKLVDKTAQLNWITTAELNFKGFVVEKSIDGNRFSAIGELPAKGNASATTNYQLIDPKPYPGNNYYRLKLVDRDGSFVYSDIVRLQTASKALAVGRIFPNPAKDNLTLELIADKDQTVNILLFDAVGKTLRTEKVILAAGLREYQMNLGNLSGGTYIVKVTNSDGNVVSESKFVKQ